MKTSRTLRRPHLVLPRARKAVRWSRAQGILVRPLRRAHRGPGNQCTAHERCHREHASSSLREVTSAPSIQQTQPVFGTPERVSRCSSDSDRGMNSLASESRPKIHRGPNLHPVLERGAGERGEKHRLRDSPLGDFSRCHLRVAVIVACLHRARSQAEELLAPAQRAHPRIMAGRVSRKTCVH